MYEESEEGESGYDNESEDTQTACSSHNCHTQHAKITEDEEDRAPPKHRRRLGFKPAVARVLPPDVSGPEPPPYTRFVAGRTIVPALQILQEIERFTALAGEKHATKKFGEEAATYAALGKLVAKKGDLRTGLMYFAEALQVATDCNDAFRIADTHHLMGEAYLKKKDNQVLLQQAEKHFLLALLTLQKLDTSSATNHTKLRRVLYRLSGVGEQLKHPWLVVWCLSEYLLAQKRSTKTTTTTSSSEPEPQAEVAGGEPVGQQGAETSVLGPPPAEISENEHREQQHRQQQGCRTTRDYNSESLTATKLARVLMDLGCVNPAIEAFRQAEQLSTHCADQKYLTFWAKLNHAEGLVKLLTDKEKANPGGFAMKSAETNTAAANTTTLRTELSNEVADSEVLAMLLKQSAASSLEMPLLVERSNSTLVCRSSVQKLCEQCIELHGRAGQKHQDQMGSSLVKCWLMLGECKEDEDAVSDWKEGLRVLRKLPQTTQDHPQGIRLRDELNRLIRKQQD
eukprot:TRINITY_DN57678_c0_g1_i1.p1 TRINITY_DN57678_c0_g1~~TRINITY_DN57678_c0_g1_i1.p1  ORF type:complete len:512 (+),score=78.12 TRINITY_DN57678_c0_g1_i1:40-1575(+)